MAGPHPLLLQALIYTYDPLVSADVNADERALSPPGILNQRAEERLE